MLSERSEVLMQLLVETYVGELLKYDGVRSQRGIEEAYAADVAKELHDRIVISCIKERLHAEDVQPCAETPNQCHSS